jgi:hypothetical protein
MTASPPQTARQQVWYNPDDPCSPEKQYEQYVRDAEVTLPELLTTVETLLELAAHFGTMFKYDRRAAHMLAVIKASNTQQLEVP